MKKKSNILSYHGNASQNYPEILTLAGMVVTHAGGDRDRRKPSQAAGGNVDQPNCYQKQYEGFLKNKARTILCLRYAAARGLYVSVTAMPGHLCCTLLLQAADLWILHGGPYTREMRRAHAMELTQG